MLKTGMDDQNRYSIQVNFNSLEDLKQLQSFILKEKEKEKHKKFSMRNNVVEKIKNKSTLLKFSSQMNQRFSVLANQARENTRKKQSTNADQNKKNIQLVSGVHYLEKSIKRYVMNSRLKNFIKLN